MRWAILLVFFLSFIFSSVGAKTVKIGSKSFTESYILAELLKLTLENEGISTEMRSGMGGTGVLASALRNSEIDIYPEYTGTIAEVILKTPELRTWESIQKGLLAQGLMMSPILGPQNNYAIAVRKKMAKEKGLNKLSQLKDFSNLKGGLSYEFVQRQDGWKRLAARYKLSNSIIAMEHSLSYRALTRKKVDFIEVYTTDPKIETHDLVILEDDLEFFPSYYTVILTRKEFATNHPTIWATLIDLEKSLTTKQMRGMNKTVELDGKSFAQAAQQKTSRKEKNGLSASLLKKLWKLTGEHLFLVFFSLFASVLVGVPLGVVGFYHRRLGHVILLISGLLQTIPALALLCFLIPLFGIGTLNSIIALFLYGLLPIVRNTYLGMGQIRSEQRELAVILGLSFSQRMRLIEFPLAFSSIMAGIKTSATINVGMATLAAFVGAGGLGTLIATGLALDSLKIILQGAIPAAVLAVLIYLLFEIIERLSTPKGLRP